MEKRGFLVDVRKGYLIILGALFVLLVAVIAGAIGVNVGEKFIVKENGNVGIGTPLPAALLHINLNNYATIQLGNDASGQGIHLTKESNDNSFNIWAGKLFTPDRNLLKITQAGNVGIGAGTPGAKLDVRDTSTVVQLSKTLSSIVTANDNGGAIYFGVDSENRVNTQIPTAAIETSWGNSLTPQIGIGVIRDGLRANILMDYNNNIYIRRGSNSAIYVQGTDGSVGIGSLAGSGNAYVCVDASGQLFRSNTACR